MLRRFASFRWRKRGPTSPISHVIESSVGAEAGRRQGGGIA